MPAVMADQAAGKPVLDQPGRAVGALEAVAAGAAQRKRRVAAAVEEEHGLLAGGDGFAQGLDQGRCQPASCRWRIAAQVQGCNVRQLGAAVTVRKMKPSVALALRIDEGFERRRRRYQDDGEPAEIGAHDRHVSGVVDDAILLLEGAVVLLVDDDQAEPGERQEQRRAGPDHDLRATLRHGAPGRAALARPQVRVPLEGRGAEARLEAGPAIVR